jgi:uncharacterized Zn finger protein
MSPSRSWDEPWTRYPASRPIPVADGIATSKQRGAMAATWWSKRFVDVLESYGLGGRMQRGRRYARTGQVVSFDVGPGVLLAQVQGSRQLPYVVSVSVAPPTDAQWEHVDTELAARVGFVARLLAGEVPADLEDVFEAAGVALFPRTWSALRATCSCPDSENPCKHIAAVLYVFADRLDADPWLVLEWRGRSRDQVLAALRSSSTSATNGDPDAVAPWWPFSSGDLPEALIGAPRPVDDLVADPPALPEAVLARLEPLPVTVRDVPIVELLGDAYATFTAVDDE